VYFYRHVWTAVPTSKVKEVAAMRKAIHAQEDRAAARQKGEQVAAKRQEMKLADAAALVLSGIEETLFYYLFRIRPVNPPSAVEFSALIIPRHLICKTTCAIRTWGIKGRCGMSSRKSDAEKARYWQRTISEAARSGMSIREFCRRRRLRESQFYWWQRKLKASREARTVRRPGAGGSQASFALVSEEAGVTDAGIELVLGDGRRLRIRQGVEEETLRSVLAALDSARC
jgi:hypothetical protein